MTILGLDCAGKTAGVAIYREDALLYEARLCAGFTHSETLLCLCQDALHACRLSPDDISLFAVTAGPGSFTGLRIGLAVVKGLAFCNETPCAGVSTLEALAFCAPPAGSCLCALDARRGEVYHAAFSLGPDGPARLWADGHAPAQSIVAQAKQLPGPLWLVGDGAHLMLQALAGQRTDDVFMLGESARCSAAVGVCLAARHAVPQNAESLSPQYLRLSQAERERKEKLAKLNNTEPDRTERKLV